MFSPLVQLCMALLGQSVIKYLLCSVKKCVIFKFCQQRVQFPYTIAIYGQWTRLYIFNGDCNDHETSVHTHSVLGYIKLMRKCKNNYDHVYFNAVSLGSSLNPRPGGFGFKQLPRATTNVNA